MTPTEIDATNKLLREEVGTLHGLLTTGAGRQAYIVALVFDGKTGKGQVITQSNVTSERIRVSIALELAHRVVLLKKGKNIG